MTRWRLDATGKPIASDRYPNITKSTVDGITFDSGREMQRYLELKLLDRAGVILNLVLQPRFPITIGGVEIRLKSKRYHKKGRHLTYVADFRYIDAESGKVIIEDVKMQSGHLTEGYHIKRALVAAMGWEITEV
jgi:hypothetical protein